MTIWNLSELSDLETTVLTAYENIPGKVQGGKTTTARIKGVIVMMAAATAFTVTNIEATPGRFSSPISAMAFAQSGSEMRPPLESIFEDRFGPDWSKEEEDRLLLKLEENREELSRTELLLQAVDSIFLNQQEDISDQADRLSRSQVEEIVKQKKLV